MALRSRLHRFLRPSAHDSRIVEQAPAVAAAEIVRRFWPLTRPYRRWIALGLLLLLVVPVIDTVEIYLFKLVVDGVLVPQELSALFPIAAAYLGLALFSALASFGTSTSPLGWASASCSTCARSSTATSRCSAPTSSAAAASAICWRG